MDEHLICADRGEIALATTYFESAIRNGSPFEAYYYLAGIQANQAANHNLPPEIISSSCSVAVSFYKIVAERGVWDEDFLTDAERSWMSGSDLGKEIAMLKWWMAAERGFELSQNNLAFILDQGTLLMLIMLHIVSTEQNGRQKYATAHAICADVAFQ